MSRLLRVSPATARFRGGEVKGCQIGDWLDNDACLDQGGAWDYAIKNCRFQ